eukprot:959409-Amphidinium_carterae.2
MDRPAPSKPEKSDLELRREQVGRRSFGTIEQRRSQRRGQMPTTFRLGVALFPWTLVLSHHVSALRTDLHDRGPFGIFYCGGGRSYLLCDSMTSYAGGMLFQDLFTAISGLTSQVPSKPVETSSSRLNVEPRATTQTKTCRSRQCG